MEKLLDRVYCGIVFFFVAVRFPAVFPAVINCLSRGDLGCFFIRVPLLHCASEGGFLLSILLGFGGVTSSPVLGTGFAFPVLFLVA